jgi:2-oxo-3-hexenedioate decarboxylase
VSALDVSIDHRYWARYLQRAVDERRAVQGIGAQIGELSLPDAYHIQDTLLAEKMFAGDSLAGAKLGLTSKAKQEQMGVDEPAYGWVPSSSVLDAPTGEPVDVVVGDLIHPRVEPEFVFVIGDELSSPTCTAGQVLDATERVVGGIEVIDSRYEAFKFTLPDVIADNTSAALAVIGREGIAPRDVDLATIECTFTVDGGQTGTATGAALLGSPAECVAMLVRHLAKKERGLVPGWIVLAGAPLGAEPLNAGTVAVASYSHFGDVVVRGA